MSLVTPLNRVLGLGSAKEGTEHWWGQRISAVALAVLGLWLVIAIAGLENFSYASVTGWVQQPLTSVLLVLTVLTLCYHSQLGVQIVVEDYVHAAGLKITTLIASTFVHVLLAAVGVVAVLRLAFGASS
ncbi:MAG: succinate dehydrogenase, hydrophobic membrane anchor protein [Gammaproteobacteria bacterium]|nr:succinate dehydrogenase, hydrophobic membrane anchor protein [Gammaproteobacteria bacterium]